VFGTDLAETSKPNWTILLFRYKMVILRAFKEYLLQTLKMKRFYQTIELLTSSL